MSQLLQVILAVPEHQVRSARQLVDHCKKLDGTVLKVLVISKELDKTFKPQFPNNPFNCLQAFGFHQGAVAAAGKPFAWFEVDSIPFRKGWLRVLSDEYVACKKPFLLPDMDGLVKFDVASGIGVYPGDTWKIIPQHFAHHGFDRWIVDHLPEKIARTRTILHSYGFYDDQGIAQPHRFPRDNFLLRPETMIFHRDKFQDLIPNKPIKTFYHSGCMGDIVAALPVMREIGGGKLVIGNHVPGKGIMHGGGAPMWGEKYKAIKSLLEAQPYVNEVTFLHGFKADYDFSTFRNVYTPTRNLTENQAAWLGVKSWDNSPWLTVEPSPETKGLISIARTERYRNPKFPWWKLVKEHGDRMVFLGLLHEYRQFVSSFGNVRYMPTSDLLKMASLIAGSRLFIGNQSVHCWIAMALGHQLIQESWPQQQDSMVIRDNAMFVTDDGELNIPAR